MHLLPMVRLSLLFVVFQVALGAGAGCSEGLRAGTGGSGGVRATGGASGADAGGAAGGTSGAGAAVGGSRSGGASGAGGTAGTQVCAKPSADYCVESCYKVPTLSDEASCSNGILSCRAGWVLASSCPERACRTTPDACCDRSTGLVSENLCAETGYRAPCPDGTVETYFSSPWCVPKGIASETCAPLDGQPCAEPAVACRDMRGGRVTCTCSQYGTDASSGTWYCSVFIGP